MNFDAQYDCGTNNTLNQIASSYPINSTPSHIQLNNGIPQYDLKIFLEYLRRASIMIGDGLNHQHPVH